MGERLQNQGYSGGNGVKSGENDDGVHVAFRDGNDDGIFGPTECRNSVTPTPTHSQVSTPMGNPGEQEFNEYIDNLVNKFQLPPVRSRPAFLQFLNRKRVAALVESDYDVAEKYDNYLSCYSYSIAYEQKKTKEDNDLEHLYMRWSNLKAEEQKINDYYNNKIKEAKDECNSKTEELEGLQEEEYQQFLNKWQNPEFLRQYNKPSPKLLQLREMEKNMAVARMYAKAKEMKAIADDQQMRDTQEAQARITKEMYDERCRLIEKQDMQKNAIESHKRKKIDQYEQERKAKLKPVQAAMSQIRSKRGSASRQSHLPPLKPANNNNDIMEAMIHSPRTYERLSHFRSEKKAVHLDVKGVDDKTLQNMRRPPATLLQPSKKTTARSAPLKTKGKINTQKLEALPPEPSQEPVTEEKKSE